MCWQSVSDINVPFSKVHFFCLSQHLLIYWDHWLSQVSRKQRMRVKLLWIQSISYIEMMKMTCSHWRHRNHKKNQGYGPPLLPDPLGLVVMFWSDHFWTPPLAFHAIPLVPTRLELSWHHFSTQRLTSRVDNLPWSIFSGFLASLFAVMVLAAMEMLATSLISTSSHFLADPPLRTNVFRLPPPSQSIYFYNSWLSNKWSLSQKVLGAVLKTSGKIIVVISRVERREAPPSGEGGGPLLMQERGGREYCLELLHNLKIQSSM